MISSTLKRELHFWDSVAINIGIIIGVGIFRVPSEVAKHLSNPSEILLAWLLGALISLAGVLCYAELSSRFPHTGGTYVFLRETFGRFAAFLYGWAEIAILRAASIAGVAYVFVDYLRHFVTLSFFEGELVAVGGILLFTFLNILGVKLGVSVQNGFSVLKVIMILGMSGVIFYFTLFHAVPFPDSAGTLPSSWSSSHVSVPALATALIPILWTYGGWHESTFMSGEFKETKKSLPVSLIAGILIVAFLYLMMNAAYLLVLSPAEMLTTDAIASEIFKRLLGAAGSAAVTIAILISAAGALNSNILTGGRIPFAMAADCGRMEWAGKVHGRFQTPAAALLLNGVWASLLVFLGSFEKLLFFSGFAKWLFFVLVALSVFAARNKTAAGQTHFLMVGYPWVPILFGLSSLWLFFATVTYAPRQSLAGALLILLGIPVYFWLRKSAS